MPVSDPGRLRRIDERIEDCRPIFSQYRPIVLIAVVCEQNVLAGSKRSIHRGRWHDEWLAVLAANRYDQDCDQAAIALRPDTPSPTRGIPIARRATRTVNTG